MVLLEDSMAATAAPAGAARLVSSANRELRMRGHFADMEGCNDYQRFWDR